MFDRLIIFGASRGLGRALALNSPSQLESLKEIHLVSRKIDLLGEIAQVLRTGGYDRPVKTYSLDLSLNEGQVKACELLKAGEFDLVIYCAGGGPHGEFSRKEWKDHRWSLEVNLMAPMRVLHEWLKIRTGVMKPGKFIAVGSRIAEKDADPLAASYSAGKSGLFGLFNSLQEELENQCSQAWLFSPGYMDTEMLPLMARVRHDGSKLMSADAAALAMLRWIKKDGPWHRVLN